MTSIDMILGFLFLFQTGFGVLGNSFLLGLYNIPIFIGHRLRPIDLVFSHLAFVNDLVLLSKGIPQTMAAFGLNNFLDNVGCKLVLYLHRVARGLSLCTTCFLSGFQAITLSATSSRWVEIKARIIKYLVPLFFSCWTFQLLINYSIILNVRSPAGIKNTTERIDLIYCLGTFDSSFISIVQQALTFSLSDVLYIGIMLGTSGYMAFVLYRHHQKVQYIHGNNLTLSSSPEAKATQTILLLVSMFITFYSLNSILALHMCLGKLTASWLVHICAFLAACFPACSPYFLIVSDSHICKYSLALWDRIKRPVQ